MLIELPCVYILNNTLNKRTVETQIFVSRDQIKSFVINCPLQPKKQKLVGWEILSVSHGYQTGLQAMLTIVFSPLILLL